MSDWQPIETAPKDGTQVLAHCQPRYFGTDEPMPFSYLAVVWWRGNRFKDSEWPWRNAYSDEVAKPTHWQPLPAPPSKT